MYGFYYILLVGSEKDRKNYINNFHGKLIIPKYIHKNFILNAVVYSVNDVKMIYCIIEVDINTFCDKSVLNNVENAIVLYNDINDHVNYVNLICKLKQGITIISVHLKDHNKEFRFMKHDLQHCSISLKYPLYIEIPLLLLSTFLIEGARYTIFYNKFYCSYINDMSVSLNNICTTVGKS